MRKGLIIAIIIAIFFSIGIGAAVYMFEKNKVKNNTILKGKQLAIEENYKNSASGSEAITTSVKEVKTSPGCTIVEKQYFKGCDHLVKEIRDIPEEWINLNEEEIKKKYIDWKLESFTNNEIIVSQEKEGFCSKHYIIREHNGLIGIYTIDEDGTETLKEDTEISTAYLPDEDVEKIKDGIKAIGDDQLHAVLEDFE